MLITTASNVIIPKKTDIQAVIIRTICLFWFIARIKSHKIWMLNDRLYPSIPVFDFLDGFPPVILESLYYITMLSLLFLLFKPYKLIAQIILFFSVFIAAIFEMTAWQPWEYQYLCMIGVFILNRKNPAALYTALILIMASIYFYSGLQKFNGGFLHSVWKGLILRKFFGIEGVNLFVHYAGLSLAIFEALAGLALVVMKNKKIPAYLLIAMHLFILVLLGTIQGFNIVLPWNIAMIIILHCLFIKDEAEFNLKYLFNRYNLIIFLLWAIMPATSFLGYWEQKLSSNLFSGRYKHLLICIDNVSAYNLKSFITNNKTYSMCPEQAKILVSEWARQEMAVVVPTSQWYHKKFKKKFIIKFNKYKPIKFFTAQYPYQHFTEIK